MIKIRRNITIFSWESEKIKSKKIAFQVYRSPTTFRPNFKNYGSSYIFFSFILKEEISLNFLEPNSCSQKLNKLLQIQA